MKIRTDFVTNSSSSSFTLVISIDLVDGDSIVFEATGGTGETGRVDYFDDDATVTVSPKELGCAKNVEELISLLQNGVIDGWDAEDGIKVFSESRPVESDCDGEEYDAYDFILEIRDRIKSMDQIESITITGDEENYECYNRTFTYNLKTKEYTGVVEGYEFEKNGSSGGDLRFSDLYSCKFEGDEEDDSWADSFPAVISIEGTGYEGRNDRIEYIKVGDPLILKADGNNPYYSPVAIEVFNRKNETLGYLKNYGAVSLTDIAKHIDNIRARVASVTPLSKRTKRAKYALLDVELYSVLDCDEEDTAFSETPEPEFTPIPEVNAFKNETVTPKKKQSKKDTALLEQQIMEFLADGDQLLSEEDICSHFYTETKRAIVNALNNLEKSGKLYSVDSFVGKMYGIDSTEEPEIVSLSDVISDSIGANANLKSFFVVRVPKHISEIDSSYLNINDTKYKTSKLTKKFMNEWFDLIESHKTYLRNLKIKAIEVLQESATQTFGGMDYRAFLLMKAQLKEELKELASIRSMYLSEIVETANAVLKNNPSSDKIDEFLRFVYSNFDYDEEDVTFNGGHDRVYVPVPKVNELRKKIVKPTKEGNSKTKGMSKSPDNTKTDNNSDVTDDKTELKQKAYDKANQLMLDEKIISYDKAAELFNSISDYKDSKELVKKCIELKENIKNIKPKVKDFTENLKAEKTFAIEKNDRLCEFDEQISKLNSQKEKLAQLSKTLGSTLAELAETNHTVLKNAGRVSELRNTRASLGLFAGKQKKKIDLEILGLEAESRRLEGNLSELKKKTKGYSSVEDLMSELNSLNQNIAELNKQKTELELRQVKTEEEMISELMQTEEGKLVVAQYRKIQELINTEYKLGNIITFGDYANKKIKWKVLSVNVNNVLLITEEAIDCKQYNKEDEDVTWEMCTLRQWLNNDFINQAFSKEEKDQILVTTVNPHKNPRYDTNQGNATKDKIFLLSVSEANQYFADTDERRCKPSAKAKANGIYISDDLKSYGNCIWWLRSVGDDQATATFVCDEGLVIELGYEVYRDDCGVRPALWIDLNS